jgi:hypothetical protein
VKFNLHHNNSSHNNWTRIRPLWYLLLSLSPTNQTLPAAAAKDCTLTSYSEPPAAAQQKTKQNKIKPNKERNPKGNL